MSIVPNSSFVSSPFFQELVERDNLQEMSDATYDLSNGLALEERFALSQRTTFKTHQVMLRLIEEQVVASEERSALRQENADLSQGNAELRQANVESDRLISNLEEDVCASMRQSIMKRTNSIWWEAFASNVISLGPSNGINTFRLTGTAIFSYLFPVPGIATFVASEVGGSYLREDAKLKMENIKKEIVERPGIMRDPRFKEKYRDTTARIRGRLKSPHPVRTDRDPSDYEVNVERVMNIRF